MVTYDEQSRIDYAVYTLDYKYTTNRVDDYSMAYSYNYNNDGTLGKVTITASSTDKSTVSYGYDALNRRISSTSSLLYGSNSVTVGVNYTFNDSASKPSQISQYQTTVNNTAVNTYKYTYDANGNITQIKDASNVIQYQYAYDSLGQLLREDNRAKNTSYVWSYDTAGNILSKKTYAFTTGTLGTVQSTINYAYNDATWGDLLTSYNGKTITYDGIGNPTAIGSNITLGWEGRNLTEYTSYDPDEGYEDTYTYTYNADGIRTSKNIAGALHTYTLDGSKIISEEFGTYLFLFMYDADGAPLGLKYRRNSEASDVFHSYLFEKNLQGDIVGLYNTSGSKLCTYTYDAWGNVTVTYSSGITSTDRIAALYNPFRYRGYYLDSETGLYYVSSRYYDPEIGRWINADSVIDQSSALGYNLFAYCRNNPVNMADTTGELPFFLVTAAIGAVVGAVVGGVVAAKNGGNVWAGIGIGAAAGGLIGAGAGAAAGVLLAGSAAASTTSVVIGAKAVASVVGSSGFSAGVKMLADNASQAYSNVSQVFWSGGDVAKNAAKQVANEIGGKTLEMTRVGAYLEQISAPYSAWQAASSNFANVASNSSSAIYSIQNASGVGIQSIWATIEYPLLQGKEIIYGVVSQSGLIQIMP